MIRIDGSTGEGGGQILRSALALSAVTGQSFRMEKIRANRSRPGLMRQHLTSLRAARDIGGEPELLFFTDGHESPPLDGPPPALFGDLRKGQIHGLVIGTGGNLPRPIPKRDSAGRDRGFWLPDEVAQGRGPDRRNEHLSARREPHLQALAFRTGLDYLRLEDFHGLSAAMQAAPRVRRREVPTDLSWVPLALALALLCAAPLGALIGNRGVRGSHRPHP